MIILSTKKFGYQERFHYDCTTPPPAQLAISRVYPCRSRCNSDRQARDRPALVPSTRTVSMSGAEASAAWWGHVDLIEGQKKPAFTQFKRKTGYIIRCWGKIRQEPTTVETRRCSMRMRSMRRSKFRTSARRRLCKQGC